MQTPEYKITAVVHFERMRASIPMSALPKMPRQASDRPLPACVVTLLRQSFRPSDFYIESLTWQQKHKTTVISDWRWGPLFWNDPTVVRKTLDLLLQGMEKPTVWMFGSYDTTEVIELEPRGLVPSEISSLVPQSEREATRGGYRSTFPLMLPLPNTEYVPFPRVQASGHGCGAFLCIYPEKKQPLRLYASWIEAMGRGEPREYEKLILAKEAAIPEALAYLSAFGHENGNHALLAKQGATSVLLAESLAAALHLPVLTTRCTEEEFRKWEWDSTLPEDLREQIHPL